MSFSYQVLITGSILEKKRQLIALQTQRKKLFEAYSQQWKSDENYLKGEQYLAALESKNELECNLNRLSTLVRLKRESVARNMQRLNRLKTERNERLRIVGKLQSSIDFMRRKAAPHVAGISVATLDRRRRDLATVRQRLIADLLNNVFPLDAVTANTAPSGSSSLEEFEGAAGMMDVINDATLTTFHHDRWIFMGNAPDVQYRLVHSCLIPDRGDYTMLKGWLFNEATAVGAGVGAGGDVVIAYSPPMTTSDSVISNRMALGTLSALAYCAQLVNAMARVLDVRLPFSLTFSDFFIDKLKESELETAIVKLNANVAFLCCTQRMDYDCVDFERPFWSLSNMSKNLKDLGYQSYFTIDARVARGFANSEKRITWSERATVMVVEQADDWENVNEQIPEWTGAASSPPTLSQLWTSATTSVVNLFKMHN